MHIVNRLAEIPLFCTLLSVLLFLLGYFIIYGLLDALLKMHRSKSAVKKLKKEYDFLQKVRLLPFEANCLHAVKFCKCIIWFQRIRNLCFLLYLLVALIVALGVPINMFLAWLTVGMFVCFDMPLFIVHRVLARPVFGRFREFSFEKYHNTNDQDSIL